MAGDAPKVTPIRLTPHGTKTVQGFVNRGPSLVAAAEGHPGGLEAWTEPMWPETPPEDELRALRCAAGLTMGDLARALGWTVAQVSSVEDGHSGWTLSREDSAAVCAWLRGLSEVSDGR
jgi:hypothetical protein